MTTRSGFTTWEIVIWFFQHLSLILYVRAPWPSLFQSMTSWTSFSLISFSTIDFRARFFFIVSVVPILFTILAHLSFRSLWFLFWFTFLLIALNMLFMAVLIAVFFPVEKDWHLVPFGVTMLILAIVVALVAKRKAILRWYRGQRGTVGVGITSPNGSVVDLSQGMARGESTLSVDRQNSSTTDFGRQDSGDVFGAASAPPVLMRSQAVQQQPPPPLTATLPRTISKLWWFRARDSTELERYAKIALLSGCLLFLLVGLGLTIRGDAYSTNMWGPVRSLVLAVCGIGIAVCVITAVVWRLAWRSKHVGRLVKRGLEIWRRDAAVLAMFAVSVWFLPVIFCCLQSWGCVTMTCPPGHVFVNKDIRMDGRPLRDVFSSGAMCVKCEYDAQCPGAVAAGLCTDFASDTQRLVADPTLSCPRHVHTTATPASVIVLIGTVAYQMFSSVHLMSKSTAILRGIDTSGIPLPLGHASHLSLPVWARVRLAASMVASGSAALSKGLLFGQFKQAKLAQGITGVLAAAFAALVHRPLVALALILALHLWEILFMLTQSVYLRLVDQWLSILLEIGLACMCVAGLGITAVPDSPIAEAFVYVALALIVALPLIGVRVAYVRSKKIDELVRKALAGNESVQTSLVFNRLRMSRVLADLAKTHLHTREAEVAKQRRAILPQSLAETHPEYQAMAQELVPDALVDGVAKANTRLLKLETDFLARYFTLTSLWAFAAVTIVTLGILRANQTGLFLSQEPMPFMPVLGPGRVFDYATYASFTDMTDNCCCRPVRGGTFLYPVAEEWVCLNSFSKLRGRVAHLRGRTASQFEFDSPGSSGTHSGLDIRPLCGRAFSPSFCPAPVLDTADRKRFTYPIQRQWTADHCPSQTNTTTAARPAQPPSTFALMRLW